MHLSAVPIVPITQVEKNIQITTDEFISSYQSNLNLIDRSDGQFFKAMEWRWLFFSNDGMAMVFENSHHHHRWFLAGSTIDSSGFSMVFPILGTNGSRWFLEGSLYSQLTLPTVKRNAC